MDLLFADGNISKYKSIAIGGLAMASLAGTFLPK